LSGYLDDELDAAARRRVIEHLRVCARCSAELEAIRTASHYISQLKFPDITPSELRRAHESLHQNADAGNWRLYTGLSAIAASILVISATWLSAIPESHHSIFRNASPAPEWEQMATSLRVDPMSLEEQPMQVADARMTEWMIQSLSESR
jgi:hypothetical protein